MTEKQEKILTAALELFAQEGYKVTSTSKVARQAAVSEGLIFRHFKNKEGLLDAIMKEGEKRAKLLFADIVLETDPKTVILKTLEMGIKTVQNQSESNFWKLQYKIKWELEEYNAHKVEPLLYALVRAFEKLNYPEPEFEANSLMILIDGLAMRYFLDQQFEIDGQIEFLKRKYNL